MSAAFTVRQVYQYMGQMGVSLDDLMVYAHVSDHDPDIAVQQPLRAGLSLDEAYDAVASSLWSGDDLAAWIAQSEAVTEALDDLGLLTEDEDW